MLAKLGDDRIGGDFLHRTKRPPGRTSKRRLGVLRSLNVLMR
jgi:hypothetical protein